jgi:hypothetical protein
MGRTWRKFFKNVQRGRQIAYVGRCEGALQAFKLFQQAHCGWKKIAATHRSAGFSSFGGKERNRGGGIDLDFYDCGFPWWGLANNKRALSGEERRGEERREQAEKHFVRV